jgi:hypothetical protein
MDGIGPIDPWLARDLAAAAARIPKTTWCVTMTDGQGHAAGHGCARPEPKSHAEPRKQGKPRAPGGIRDGPPGSAVTPDEPDRAGFSFTPESREGPPGGYGT